MKIYTINKKVQSRMAVSSVLGGKDHPEERPQANPRKTPEAK